MNLYEKSNRLDDSLVESKRVVKKKKLTEGYRVDPKISKFNVGDRVAERYNDSEFNVGTIIQIKQDTEGTQYLVKWDYSDREDEEWLYGDILSLWIEDETDNDYDDDIDGWCDAVKWEVSKQVASEYDDLGIDTRTGKPFGIHYDIDAPEYDDIDEMLTEATEKTIYSVDYYEPKLDKWIRYYSDSSVDKVKKYLNTPMIGNPMRRLAQYKVTGVRKPNYTLVKELDVSYGKYEESLVEGNNVSSQLPPAIDSFLQDIAQMYGTITYKDIIQHKYSDEDLKQISKLRRKFRVEAPYEGDEAANIIMQDIANKVAVIVKGQYKLSESANTHKLIYLYVSKDRLPVVGASLQRKVASLESVERADVTVISAVNQFMVAAFSGDNENVAIYVDKDNTSVSEIEEIFKKAPQKRSLLVDNIKYV